MIIENGRLLNVAPENIIDGIFHIPETVTAIGEYVFQSCTALTSIIIPESVTSIEEGAFKGCTSLANIRIPEGITMISRHTFKHCSSLISLSLPKSVTIVGNGAFKDCISLTSITFPSNITKISDRAFKGCTSLTSIPLPEGVIVIGEGAFEGCTSLANVSIPKDVTTISEDAFNDCISLGSIFIPEGVTTIGKDAFKNCISLTNITIPEGVTTIGDRAFLNCIALTKITIPESVTTICDSAFWNCTALTQLIITEGISTIEKEAFDNCSSLTEIFIPTENPGTFERIKNLLPEHLHSRIYNPNKDMNDFKALCTHQHSKHEIGSEEWQKEVSPLIERITRFIDMPNNRNAKEYKKELDSQWVKLYLQQGQFEEALAYCYESPEISRGVVFELANSILMHSPENTHEKHRVLLYFFKNYAHHNEIKTFYEKSALALLSKTGSIQVSDTPMNYGMALFLPCSELIKTIQEQKNLEDNLKTQFIDKVHLLTARELLTLFNTSPFKETIEKTYNTPQIVTYESLLWPSVAQDINDAQSNKNTVDWEQVDVKARQEQYLELMNKALDTLAATNQGNENERPATPSLASARFFESSSKQNTPLQEQSVLDTNNSDWKP